MPPLLTRLLPAAAFLRRRARAARAERRFADAALLYEELLRLRPADGALRVQCGHMRKEAGDLVQAGRHYQAALEAAPDDPELALQVGHWGKAAGDHAAARAAYARALALRPGWAVAAAELAAMPEPPADPAPLPAGLVPVPELLPGRPDRPPLREDWVEVGRVGRMESWPDGDRPSLRGVEAIRGYCVTRATLVEAQLLVAGMAVQRAPLRGPFPVTGGDPAIRKYVFNLWHDFTGFTPGRRTLEVRLRDADGGTRSFHATAEVAAPLDPADHPFADGIVPVVEPDPARLPAAIAALPTLAHPARRSLFPEGIRSVAVLRTDQLGDLVASVPAVRRLRALLPDARLVGLLTAANVDLARTLGLFDAVEVVDFPDDPVERRRVMDAAAQAALAARLAAYRFDVAIDLARSDVSRPLLRLTGARFTHGFGEGARWPWLTSQLAALVPDRWSRGDDAPHAAGVLALVEGFGALLDRAPEVVRRDDLPRTMLASCGLPEGCRYALLHGGARLAFSRWPYLGKLAELLLADTGLHVVLLVEEEDFAAGLPAAVRDDPRLRVVVGRQSFDRFDALVSHAAVLVGNDSGPKHLAALRGVPAVTLFTARIGWAEWGQEGTGEILARRVPCQGCAIFHDPEECGRDFACIRDIAPAEVLAAVQRQLAGAAVA